MPPRLTCRAFTPVTTPCAVLALSLALSLALLITLAQRPAVADGLADFNAAVEKFAGHNRVALGYLRTGNTDLAGVEFNGMKSAWRDVISRFAKSRPPEFRGNPAYDATLTGVQKKISDSDALMNDGKADAARDTLQAIREQLSTMRTASRVTVLPDCILQANKAMAAFFKFDDAPPDFTKPDLKNAADQLGAIAKRCDGIAEPAVRNSPEFRRLIDGTLNSLTFVPKMIETRDRDMLTRVIGELRALDNLLSFRYG
jgi:hypothetical protein